MGGQKQSRLQIHRHAEQRKGGEEEREEDEGGRGISREETSGKTGQGETASRANS